MRKTVMSDPGVLLQAGKQTDSSEISHCISDGLLYVLDGDTV